MQQKCDGGRTVAVGNAPIVLCFQNNDNDSMTSQLACHNFADIICNDVRLANSRSESFTLCEIFKRFFLCLHKIIIKTVSTANIRAAH